MASISYWSSVFSSVVKPTLDNMRSGPILALLIHFLLRAPAKIGPDTNSLTFVLTAARFWPQRWLAVRTMPEDLIGCRNQQKLKALIPRLADSSEKSSWMIRRHGDWEGFCSRLFFSSYCFTILSSHVWKISILKNMPRKWFWLVDSAYVNQSKKWAADVSWKVCIRLSFRFAFTAVHKAKRKGSRISGYTLGDGLRLPFYPFTLEIVSKYMQWNPFNTVTNGSKNLAVLTAWPYYRGRLKFHDLTAVMTNTPYIAVAFLEQLFSLINNRSVDIAYSNKKNYSLHFPFST